MKLACLLKLTNYVYDGDKNKNKNNNNNNNLWCGAQQTPPPSECNWLWAMASDNKQLDLRAANPLTGIDPKLNQVVPWSLHTFPENFMQIGPAVFS